MGVTVQGGPYRRGWSPRDEGPSARCPAVGEHADGLADNVQRFAGAHGKELLLLCRSYGVQGTRHAKAGPAGPACSVLLLNAEDHGRGCAAEERPHQGHPRRALGGPLPTTTCAMAGPSTDGGVERPARETAAGEGGGKHGAADRRAVVGVAGGCLAVATSSTTRASRKVKRASTTMAAEVGMVGAGMKVRPVMPRTARAAMVAAATWVPMYAPRAVPRARRGGRPRG